MNSNHGDHSDPVESFAAYQHAWKASDTQLNVAIDLDQLSKEVQRIKDQFQSIILWRDIREVGVALTLVPIWLVMGVSLSLPWTWYLTVPALLWVAGFMVIDRLRHPQRPSESGEPLLFYATESLQQVEHQIWLLRNVFWWYLLPFCISILSFFAQVTWTSTHHWFGFLLGMSLLSAFLWVVYGLVYRLNQAAVCKTLEPRRQDLLRLVNHFQQHSDDDTSGDLTELVTDLFDPTRSGGLNAPACSTNIWNRMIPTWREVRVIVLATVMGAIVGLGLGLGLQIPAMGPVLFQVVVGAVVSFQLTLGWIWWRTRQNECVMLVTSPDSSPPSRLPRAPAVLVILLALFLGVMAMLALVAFQNHLLRSW